MTQLHDLRQTLAVRWPGAFSAAEVARRVGVSERTLRRWEAGEDWPRRRNLQALMKELGFRVVDGRPEAVEAAAGLARLQPLMAERAIYIGSDDTFREVAIIVRDTTAGLWHPASAVEASLRRAEAANPLDTQQGELIREAATLLRTTASLAAQLPPMERRVGTLELALQFQPNSFPVVRDQLRAIGIPGHPDIETTYLTQPTASTIMLKFDFKASSTEEAEEIARLYADRVVVQFHRYGARVLRTSVA